MDPVIAKILERNKAFGLSFNAEKHEYTLADGVPLTSVTTSLKRFFPFDAQAISAKVAEARGVSQQEILDAWAKTADFGTDIHELAERYSNGEHLTGAELDKIPHVIAFFQTNPQLEVIGCEVKIFSKKFRVAGTVDLVVRNKNNNRIYVLDYKTCSKDIIKWEEFQRAQGVLSEFPNNKFYNYSTQVSVYSYILREEYGVDVYDSMLIHLKPDKSYQVIKTEDMGMFVEDMF